MRVDVPETPEDRLADTIESRSGGAEAAPGRVRDLAVRGLRTLGQWDRAVYAQVAEMSTPALDAPLRRLSHFANHSKPWFAVAAVLALVGGPRGRRAAATGVAAIGVTSLVVNQPMKLAGDRPRPDREGAGVPEERWVRMPTSSSFPSGHSASAVAFAVAVGDVVPALRWPLRVAGSVVAFSRVYTGVHYPGDVAAGVVSGLVIGRSTARVGRRIAARRAVRP
jgi:undecaprenyl-diphosphatase